MAEPASNNTTAALAQAAIVPPWPLDRRLFFGVAPSAAQQRQLVALQAQLPSTMRAVEPANLHLTLRFLGQVSYPQALAMCQQLDAWLLGSQHQDAHSNFQSNVHAHLHSSRLSHASDHSGAIAATPLRQFSVRLDSLEWWSGPRVVCLAGDLLDPALAQLDNALDALALAQCLAPRQHPLRPHITLARPARRVVSLPILALELNAHELLLYHSYSSPTGVRYLPLARWPLLK